MVPVEIKTRQRRIRHERGEKRNRQEQECKGDEERYEKSLMRKVRDNIYRNLGEIGTV